MPLVLPVAGSLHDLALWNVEDRLTLDVQRDRKERVEVALAHVHDITCANLNVDAA
jgi:hypothetical protein